MVTEKSSVDLFLDSFSFFFVFYKFMRTLKRMIQNLLKTNKVGLAAIDLADVLVLVRADVFDWILFQVSASIKPGQVKVICKSARVNIF